MTEQPGLPAVARPPGRTAPDRGRRGAARRARPRRAGQLSHTAFLERLLALEVTAVTARRQASLARFACLPAPWQISDFDFDAQPSIDRKLVRELATLRFLDDATNVLLIGPPGVGKTMLAVGLGHAAVAAGYRTYYTTAADLVARCHRPPSRAAGPPPCGSSPAPGS